MAMENVGRFLGKYAMDEALQAQLEDKTPEEVVAIAKEAGFDFTVEELKEATQPIQKLTPEELDATTGGFAFAFAGVRDDALAKAVEVSTGVAGAIKTVKETAGEIATEVEQLPGAAQAKGLEISGTIVSKYGDNCVVRFLGNLANKF